jgi:hypothetical protein
VRSADYLGHAAAVQLPDGEPRFGPWRARRIDDVLDDIGRPRVVAVDGRGGGGKTVAATRIAARVPGATVVHTDDIAWNHAMFDWAELVADGVLRPVRRGEAVAFRPPAWDVRQRPGAVVVPAGCPLVLVEGVGIGRRALADLVDALMWVQSDLDVARTRALVRDGGGAAEEAFWDEWQAEERPFLAADRPWERADVVIDGAPGVPHDPLTELVVSDGEAGSPLP